MCIPPIKQIASEAPSTTVASSPPTPGPGGPFGVQNAEATYQKAIYACLNKQIGYEIETWSDLLGYTTPSYPTSDSEGDDTTPTTLAPKARALAAWAGRCGDLAANHQPAPASHFVAMVCDNCFVNHGPEDCIIDGFISDCSIDIADLLSLSDAELLLAPIVEVESTQLASTSASTNETEDNQPTTTTASEEEEAPQAITLQQVMMAAPAGTSSAPVAPIAPSASWTATTTVGLATSQFPTSGPTAAMTSAPQAPPAVACLLPQELLGFPKEEG